MRALSLVVVLPVLIALVLLAGCPQEQITEEKREVFVDGKKAEDVSEIVRKNRTGGELVQRRHVLVSSPDDAVLSLASLDEQGFATGASYRWEGKKGKRYVELAHKDGKIVVFSRGDDETLILPNLPVVVLDVLHRLHAKPAQDVILLDLEDAVALPAKIDARGALTFADGTPVGPVVGGRVDVKAGTKDIPTTGASPKIASPTAGDPVLPAHSSRAPFLEAKTNIVVTWCRAQALGSEPLQAARALALATKPKISDERAGGPPSAFMAVQIGGGDEHGAALVVACLRALEIPSRVVSGVVGDAPAWRTWAQVAVPSDDAKTTQWLDVDPLDIDLDGKSAQPHRALVEGFRGPLTTGLLPRSTPP
jgi:hypothetical protein